MLLILMGAPGSGKGTQAKLLIERFGLDHISTGDMLRATVAEDSALGREVKEILEEGRLVSDELVAQLVDHRLDHNCNSNGFIMDGYPRTETQTCTFDQSLGRLGLSLDAVILLEVDDDIVASRVSGRRLDPETGQIYNINEDENAIDPEVRNRLQQREDDTDKVVRDRLNIYHQQTAPVIEHYQHQGLLLRVDGMAPPDEVGVEILRQLETIAQRS